MKYLGKSDYEHGTGEKLGILVVNLGTPDAPETKAVRRYLAEFLSDPRIITVSFCVCGQRRALRPMKRSGTSKLALR